VTLWRWIALVALAAATAMALFVPFSDTITFDLTPEALGEHQFERRSFDCPALIPPESRSYDGYGYTEYPCDDGYRQRTGVVGLVVLVSMVIVWHTVAKRRRGDRADEGRLSNDSASATHPVETNRVPGPEVRLTMRIIEALVHLDGRIQELEARS
jgi:hypothetical protein